MSKLAIVYHSAHGHTEFFARQVQAGASDVDEVDARLVKAQDIARTPDELVGYDGFIFGSPTYLGGVSSPFKGFMDATGRLWRTQQLKGNSPPASPCRRCRQGTSSRPSCRCSSSACSTACCGSATRSCPSSTAACLTTRPRTGSAPGRG